MPMRPRALAVALPLALLIGALAAGPAGAAKAKPKAPKLGPNLVVNPGFEQSVFEGNAAAKPGSLAQPVLPVGWTFEGATALFDHSPNGPHDGKRYAAISGSFSGGRKRCDVTPAGCVDLPTNIAKDATSKYYSVVPNWRTKDGIPVTAGTKYAFSTWISWAIVTIGKGAETHVRWLDASGLPLSQVPLVTFLSNNGNNQVFNWKQFATTVVAPTGAKSAVLLLGQSDDAWTGQVKYDDVYFGTSS